jgi:hypothetical protein
MKAATALASVTVALALASSVGAQSGDAPPLSEAACTLLQQAQKIERWRTQREDDLVRIEKERFEAILEPYVSTDHRNSEFARLERLRAAAREDVQQAEQDFLTLLNWVEIQCDQDTRTNPSLAPQCHGAARRVRQDITIAKAQGDKALELEQEALRRKSVIDTVDQPDYYLKSSSRTVQQQEDDLALLESKRSDALRAADERRGDVERRRQMFAQSVSELWRLAAACRPSGPASAPEPTPSGGR